MKRYYIVGLIVIICWSVYAYGQKITVSVTDLKINSGLSATDGEQLTRKLLNELAIIGTYEVLDIAKRDEILKEQGFQQAGACDQGSCLVEVGKLLGVTRMIGGSIGKLGAAYSVELQIVDVKTSAISMPFSRTYTGDVSVLLVAMKEAAAEFCKLKSTPMLSQAEQKISIDVKDQLDSQHVTFKSSGYVNRTSLGLLSGDSATTLTLSIVNGIQLGKYFTLGIGTGFDVYKKSTMIPLCVDACTYFPGGRYSPFVLVDVGYSLGKQKISETWNTGGIILNAGIGFRGFLTKYISCSIEASYRHQQAKEEQKVWYDNWDYTHTYNFGRYETPLQDVWFNSIRIAVGFSF